MKVTYKQFHDIQIFKLKLPFSWYLEDYCSQYGRLWWVSQFLLLGWPFKIVIWRFFQK